MSKSNMRCEVIQDLFPSYIDGIASESTIQVIEEHIKECDDCKNMLNEMKEPIRDEAEILQENAEINFLKKNKKRTRNIVIGVVVAAIIVVMIGLCIVPFLHKDVLCYEDLDIDLQVGSIMTDGVEVTNGTVGFMFQTYGKKGISEIEYHEENGVLEVNVLGGIIGPGRESIYEDRYVSKESIEKIVLDGKTIWENGVTVTRETVALFATKHPYVGDHVANGDTLSAVGVYDVLGAYTLELQTQSEPYGMIVHVTTPMDKQKQSYAQKFMRYASYTAMALVDNLSYVTFTYVVDNKSLECTYSTDDAKEQLGVSIKEFGENEASLELLKWEL